MTWRIFADTGGTFTDLLGQDASGKWHTCKVLSDGSLRGRVADLDTESNTVRLELNSTFVDGFFIGYQLEWSSSSGERKNARIQESTGSLLKCAPSDTLPDLDDLVQLKAGEEAPVLGARVMTQTALDENLDVSVLNLATTRGTNALLELKGARVLLFTAEGCEDLLRIDDQRRSDIFALEIKPRSDLTVAVIGLSLRILNDGSLESAGDAAELEARICDAVSEHQPDSVAVCFPHSYRYPEQEERVGAVLNNLDLDYRVLSVELSRLGKLLPRMQTSVVDAYLGPIMESYLDRVSAPVKAGRMRVMTSAGGLLAREDYRAKDGLLSGPAGGITGVAAVAKRAGFERVIAFDMGGTSTDVSRVDGDLELRNQHQVGVARIQAAALRIETVAAGGGSICSIRDGHFRVGPESAGAFPGPACYGAGGPLTVTDVNLLLGNLSSEDFQIPVDRSASERALEPWLQESRNVGEGETPSREAVLEAFRDIANERMAEALRLISVKEGFDASEYTLVAFGGAGGQHACALARLVGMKRVLIPWHAGILSAFGLSQARDSVVRLQRLQIDNQDHEGLSKALAALESEVTVLAKNKLEEFKILTELELRFQGQENTLDVSWSGQVDALEADFLERYRAMFGYLPEDRSIEVVNARCRAEQTGATLDAETFRQIHPASKSNRVLGDPYTTIVVEPGWRVSKGSEGSTLLEFENPHDAVVPQQTDLLRNTLMANRLHGLVVEMGEQLERTAVSTNVKERLDFSCAITDERGILLFNAPHIPVHLGALGVCVRRVLEVIELQEGDVAITNHPGFGGSHLPDITLLMPIFVDGTRVGFAINRAHHAEVGGIVPGSMSPFASNLQEEGVVIYPEYIIRKGVDCFSRISGLLKNAPYPSRRIAENISDLRAQLAALNTGASGLIQLVRTFGVDVYRSHIHNTLQSSADAMRKRIQELGTMTMNGSSVLDDGDQVSVEIRAQGQQMIVDFTGTSAVREDSLNANEAITRSALLYVLRLWLGDRFSMNEGVLEPVEIRLPESLVCPHFSRDPAECPAVVGGNVEISQRIVDALIRALGLQAGSQATMNNFIFGNEHCSYYETICGGSGAGEGYPGQSAVHTHMTNTAITDLEILEERYPVVLESFKIREDSGGPGKRPGGNGVLRRIRFLETMHVSMLAQSRTAGGFGLNGGQDGLPGVQYLIRKGQRIPLNGLFNQTFQAGDILEIQTPGGGGYGSLE